MFKALAAGLLGALLPSQVLLGRITELCALHIFPTCLCNKDEINDGTQPQTERLTGADLSFSVGNF